MFSRIDWILVILIVRSVIFFYRVEMCLDLKVDGRVSLTHFTQAYFKKLSRLNECL